MVWRKVNPIETRLQAVLYSLFTAKSLWACSVLGPKIEMGSVPQRRR